jgi:hypothetical protein
MILAAAGVSLAAAEPPRSQTDQTASKPSTVCTMIYMPVCGWDKDGKQQTYSNECFAKAAGATGIYPGPCISDITR